MCVRTLSVAVVLVLGDVAVVDANMNDALNPFAFKVTVGEGPILDAPMDISNDRRDDCTLGTTHFVAKNSWFS
jgi:hypothetical protein